MDHSSDPLYLGYEQLHAEVSTLVASYPPPFLYINDTTSPRVSGAVIGSILEEIQNKQPGPSKRVHFARINAIACFSARLLYDSILNSLTRWEPSWNDGCANWHLEDDEQRWNENFDGFIHGLRAVSTYLRRKSTGKGKGKEKMSVDDEDVRLVIVVERAERLRETLPELMVPLTRLAELTQLDLTMIFISSVRWEDIRPPLGASPDPYFIDVPPPTKEIIAQRVTSKFPLSNDPSPGPYHASLRGLYTHFVSVLCDVCYPFTHDPQEIEYIAAARWPGFVQPVLDQHQRATEADMDLDTAEEDESRPKQLAPPSEDVRMRLSRLFNASLNTALEDLYPRLTNAADWAETHKPEPDLLAKHPGHVVKAGEAKVNAKGDSDGMEALPRMSKFILIAAFLASTNPHSSDLRMFGRGLDEKKRKRRARKAVGSGPAKIPQRLVGPVAFPLDRLLAILGALLEENDVEARLPAPEYTIPGEYTDMETSRVGVYTAIMDLTSMRLLHRTSAIDRIDGPPTFKCGISYDVTMTLARELGIPLNDLMWDPV
ncbi:Origin recognition complex subunit 5 [Hypsizygus marmoreus]|uniref:Origin recognition complex subunit 5 n=1 Tax=Hypsizygus marmoreus TaxID=39966 RepID=A0A369JAK4_HYPMA|nr:Origin recognition complex subunit 5 [Hypsizygus marmoreus]